MDYIRAGYQPGILGEAFPRSRAILSRRYEIPRARGLHLAGGRTGECVGDFCAVAHAEIGRPSRCVVVDGWYHELQRRDCDPSRAGVFVAERCEPQLEGVSLRRARSRFFANISL